MLIVIHSTVQKLVLTFKCLKKQRIKVYHNVQRVDMNMVKKIRTKNISLFRLTQKMLFEWLGAATGSGPSQTIANC